MKRLFALLFLAGSIGWAAPDCQYSFKFTNRAGDQTDGITQISGAAPTPAINNRDNACIGWQLTYDSEGFSAISLNFQSAPVVVYAPNLVSQGAWSTFSGTNTSGSLPLTGTASGAFVSYGYFPWLRVNLASVTGTGSISVKLSGWKSVTYVVGLGSGGAGSGTVGPGTTGKLSKFTASTTVSDAAASDVVAEFSGTPDGTKFLRDDGTLVTPAGGALSVQNAGSATGTESTLNFAVGVGIAITGSHPTGKVTQTIAIDPADTLRRLTDQAGTDKYCASASGNDTYACTATPTLTTYTAGACFVLTPDTTNTGTASVNIDTVGAVQILYRDGTALEDGDIPANIPSLICYNGTNFYLTFSPRQRFIPQRSVSTTTTTVLTDCGKEIYHPGADTTARTWTIDSNANVAAPIGCTITFTNDTSAGVVTIAITSDTMILGGAGTTGSRTLAASGIATAKKITSTRWIITGSGLT